MTHHRNQAWRQWRIWSLILGVLWGSTGSIQADPISSIISYQGQLTDNTGAPLANNTYSLTFKIYENTNTVVFNQTSNVATVGGVFSIFLGVGALSFDPTKSYEMGVTYNGNEVRHSIAAVPFALNAKSGAVQSDGTTLSGTGTAANPLAVKAGGVGQTQVSNGYVDLTNPQTVAGSKTFSNPVNTTSPQYNINGNRVLSNIGTQNLFVGDNIGTAGSGNALVGFGAGLSNGGNNNVLVGKSAGQINSGNANVFVGANAGLNHNLGDNNIALGNGAGQNNGNGSNNIHIGHNGADESNTIRLGATQSNTFVAGIRGTTGLTGTLPVVVDSNGQLGAGTAPTNGTVTSVAATGPLSVSNPTTTPTIALTGAVPIANGGTGSTTQNFVDLSSDQTVGGSKTFSSPVNSSSQYNIGGNRVLSIAGPQNTFVGSEVGLNNTTGFANTFVGSKAGQNNTTADGNTFIGSVDHRLRKRANLATG